MSFRTIFATLILTLAFVSSSQGGDTYARAGWKAVMPTGAHQSSGVATIIDSKTIVITDATYDGTAPQAFIYIGNLNPADADKPQVVAQAFRQGLTVSPRLTTRLSGETLTVSVPDGQTLDSYNAICFWCRAIDNYFTFAIFTAPDVASGSDSDKDGFSDAIETKFGTEINNSASTPTGRPAGTPAPLAASTFTAKLSFQRDNTDALTFGFTLPASTPAVPITSRICIELAGMALIFTPDSRGQATDGTAKLSVKAARDGAHRVTLKISRGTLTVALREAGLVDGDIKNRTLTLPVSVIRATDYYRTGLEVTYSARAGKSGAAKINAHHHN